MLIFDIESGPLPDVELAKLCPPYELPPHPGDFDPASVKVGNLGEAKAKEKIDAAREAHKAAVAGYEAACQQGAEQHFAAFKSNAALSATTGRVLAIGFQAADNGKVAIDDGGGDEVKLITAFWAKYAKCRATVGGPRKMVGWNIHGFDLPFLIKRSWFHGIEVPATVMDASYRNWDSAFVDLMQRFCIGQWKGFEKLDAAAKFFGCNGKPDGVTGADFARLWNGTAEERNQAVAYLKNDLAMTAAVAKKLGVV